MEMVPRLPWCCILRSGECPHFYIFGPAYGEQSDYISTVEFRSDLGFGLTLETLQRCKRLLEEMAAVPALLDAVLRISVLVEAMGPASIPGGRQRPTVAYEPLISDTKSSVEVMMRQTQGVFELVGKPGANKYPHIDFCTAWQHA